MDPTGDGAERELELAAKAMEALDGDAAVTHLSAAVRRLTAAGDTKRAAMASAQLGDIFANFIGNLTAARAWFLRATRLIEHEPPCIEQGWVAVAAMGCDVDDPAELLERAELALDRARRFGDVNLETKALADAGLAHVQAGRVREGMALLDEAMALVCGAADDEDTVGRSVCSFFTACYYSADFDRAGTWAPTLRRHGVIGSRPGAAVFLSNHCDSVQATALCELGRWGEAEDVLKRAIAEFEARMPVPSWHPAIALAELRIRQERLAEAEALLVGKDAHLQALLPAARLHLARGDLDLARATASRGLRAIRGDRLRAAELLAVLVATELAAGDLGAAVAACDGMVARAEGLDVPTMQARVASARGRVMAATGDTPGAVATVEAALDALPPAGLLLHRALLLVDLVRLHDQAGDRAAATVEARRAAAALDGLDATLPAEDAALLRRYGTGLPSEPGKRHAPRPATMRREGKGWELSDGSTRYRVADGKGMRYLAELVAAPGTERHSLDLVDRVEGVGGATAPDRRRLGDAGAVLDSQARAAYRRRIEALRSEVDAALEAGADRRAEALQAELDELVAQLAGAFGLGGRSRPAASAAERARVNVTRALRSATARVRQALPEAGEALDRRLRTGLYCAYEPQPDDDFLWSVHS